MTIVRTCRTCILIVQCISQHRHISLAIRSWFLLPHTRNSQNFCIRKNARLHMAESLSSEILSTIRSRPRRIPSLCATALLWLLHRNRTRTLYTGSAGATACLKCCSLRKYSSMRSLHSVYRWSTRRSLCRARSMRQYRACSHSSCRIRNTYHSSSSRRKKLSQQSILCLTLHRHRILSEIKLGE